MSDHTLVIPRAVAHRPMIHESRRQGAYARIPVFTGMCGCRKPPYMGIPQRTAEEAWEDLRRDGHVAD